MRISHLIAAATLAIGATTAFTAMPASATGKITCNAPKAEWKSRVALETKLKAEGWKIKKSKVDGGCYEVYATLPDGKFVEAYFHPVTFEKLYVSQRGKVLFRKAD